MWKEFKQLNHLLFQGHLPYCLAVCLSVWITVFTNIMWISISADQMRPLMADSTLDPFFVFLLPRSSKRLPTHNTKPVIFIWTAINRCLRCSFLAFPLLFHYDLSVLSCLSWYSSSSSSGFQFTVSFFLSSSSARFSGVSANIAECWHFLLPLAFLSPAFGWGDTKHGSNTAADTAWPSAAENAAEKKQ